MNAKNLGKLNILVLLLILVAPSILPAQSLPVTENQKIETLIKQVGDLKDAAFVRNGSIYSAWTAVVFLRGKWNANTSAIKTAHDFIDKVGTMSGTSGEPYLIRFGDGKEIHSRDYLLAELKKIEP